MPSARSSTTLVSLLLGGLLGVGAGYLLARASEGQSSPGAANHAAELAQIRAELDELKARHAVPAADEQMEQLQAIVTDILLRGDEFALRAEFARRADRLGGRAAAEFALRDADGDGADDLEQLRQKLDGIVSGATPVAKAKKADSAGNTDFLGNLALTDFALADHTHPTLTGDVNMLDNVRVGGVLTVAGNTIASGDMQVFGEVVAVGGLLPGAVDIDPKPAIAGMIRYNRRTGALEYCDGSRWNEVAVVQVNAAEAR